MQIKGKREKWDYLLKTVSTTNKLPKGNDKEFIFNQILFNQCWK